MRRRVLAAGVIVLLGGAVLAAGFAAGGRAVGRVADAAAAGQYFVFILTNVADPGNIWVGLESDLKGKRTCDFTDGGLCANQGGKDVPVTYVAKTAAYPSCNDALRYYYANAMNPHPAFGGTKVYIFGGSYFIDNKGRWCNGGAVPPPAPTTTTSTTAPTTTTSTTTSTGSSNPCGYATVVAATGDVGAHGPGNGWADIGVGGRLGPQDDLHTGPDSSATIRTCDGATFVISELTQVKIGELLDQQNRPQIRLFLVMGQIKAQKPPVATIRSGFSVSTTIATVSVRGTVLSAYYDPVARVGVFSVVEGHVEVDPANASLPKRLLHTGQEVEVTRTKETPPAPLGRAGVPAGDISRPSALALVEGVLGKNAAACKLTVSALTAVPGSKGWTVSAKVTTRLGSGWPTWTITGTKITHANPLAAKITRGCR